MVYWKACYMQLQKAYKYLQKFKMHYIARAESDSNIHWKWFLDRRRGKKERNRENCFMIIWYFAGIERIYRAHVRTLHILYYAYSIFSAFVLLFPNIIHICNMKRYTFWMRIRYAIYVSQSVYSDKILKWMMIIIIIIMNEKKRIIIKTTHDEMIPM